MARQLTANVLVRNPDTSQVEFLPAGSDLPDWAVDLVGEHALDGPMPDLDELDPDDPARQGEMEPPPQTGKGSGQPAWAEYAAEMGVKVDPAASRDEIIEALRAAEVRVE